MDRYQDAYRPGGTETGERDCAARWDLIAEHLPHRGTLLDIGSNLGYFGLRCVDERPEVAVISVESDPLIAARQAALIDEHATDRITLLQGTLSAGACEAWSRTCDAVDTTLLLAVIHWFDDPARAVAALSSMSGHIVAEVPHPDDAGACGQDRLDLWTDPVAWFNDVTGRPTRMIGRMARHTSDVPSYVVLVDGPVERTPSLPYWGSTHHHVAGNDYRVRQDAGRTELWIRGDQQDYVAGVNLVSLMHLGALVRPLPATWRRWFQEALAAAPDHPDPLPHNAVWTPAGLVFVDDEPTDALVTPADGLRALDRNLALWPSGATARGDVEVRSLTRLQRWHRTPAGQAVSRIIPAPVRRALRRPLRWGSELRRRASA